MKVLTADGVRFGHGVDAELAEAVGSGGMAMPDTSQGQSVCRDAMRTDEIELSGVSRRQRRSRATV